jgi:hypothetical protein
LNSFVKRESFVVPIELSRADKLVASHRWLTNHQSPDSRWVLIKNARRRCWAVADSAEFTAPISKTPGYGVTDLTTRISLMSPLFFVGRTLVSRQAAIEPW